ncbi:TPA: HNH endonuclease [Salmonella enterica subsp. salamae serovar 21:z10:[z6]]|nr:hypothetical protein [Salmonella enterica]ECC9704863.1 hypothetical protein [Salmonella enterica subsp. salamae]HCM2006114.1 HNH endonuclease [Salmonella enterica subsp. salamae serovar 21:z10:[z6]]
MTMIDQRELKILLRYNPDTGVFYWLKDMGLCCKAGDIAGGVCKVNGYIRIGIKGRQYKAHRLAFLYMTGRWPRMIDHINRNRKDNRWINLRECVLQQNNLNISVKSNNTSGVPGVSWKPHNEKWRVTMQLNGIQYSFGCYRDLELAELVARESRVKYFGDFSPAY